MNETTNKSERDNFQLTFGFPLNAESTEAATVAADGPMKNEELALERLQGINCGLGGDDPVPSHLAPNDTSQGSRNQECFSVMTRYLPKKWFEYFYGDGGQMSYRDEVVVHDIDSCGLSTEEKAGLRTAELESAIFRIQHDPACRPLLRSILTKAIGEGVLNEFDTQRSRIMGAQSACGTDDREN